MKMKALTAVPVAVLALSGIAHAQEMKPLGLSIRAGLFFPSSEAARNAGKTWFAGGLEYKLGDLHYGMADPGMSVSWSISADYYSKGDLRNVPVLVNLVGRRDQWFYSAGAGVGFGRYPRNFNIEDKTDFAYQLGIGYDFQRGSTPLFVEVKWLGSAKTELSGFAAYIGVRF